MKKQATRARHSENEPEPAQEPVKKITIGLRAAVPRDATELYDVLLRYFDELKLFYPAPVPAPTMAWGLGIIVKGGVVVAVQDEKIVGSIGMEIGHFPWAPSVGYLNGVWFYVAPERRGGDTANRLMKAAKDMARENKMGLRLDNVWGVEPRLQDRYREIHGFQYVGGNHVWFPGESGA